MKVRAEFCISHGDEMKLYGMSHEVPTAIFDHTLDHIWEFGMGWHYEQMAGHLITGVLHEQDEGRIGESAHLVTHPADRGEE